MRKLALAIGLSLLSFGACAGTPQVHNIAMSFADFWDANKDKPAPEQLAVFKSDVAPGFPTFYGIERYNGHLTQADKDALIEKAIQEFPASARPTCTRRASSTPTCRAIWPVSRPPSPTTSSRATSTCCTR